MTRVMKVVVGLETFAPPPGPVCVALGTFDGLHLGHRAVIDAVRAVAQRSGGQAVATTFDPHPLAIIAPPPEPFLLSTLDERIALFAATGIDALVVIPFDARLREIEAEEWLELLERHLAASHLVVSSNHTFGRNRRGTVAMLHDWARARRVEVVIVPPVRDGDEVVSSSGIRALLRRGDVRRAAAGLGRWYSLSGPVVRGEGRGRRLGIPTANIHVPRTKLVPARGVYAAYATVGGATYRSAVNIGVRPTFGGSTQTVEAHLLGAEGDLYDQVLTVALVDRLRPEMAFSGPESLVSQVSQDVQSAARLLSDVPYEKT